MVEFQVQIQRPSDWGCTRRHARHGPVITRQKRCGCAPQHSRARSQVCAAQVETAVDTHVQDDGPGVSADDRDHLFELLFRSQAKAGKVHGAGIRLFVCRTLARAMGGDIRIEGPPGRGSDFVVRLPMYLED
jgi:signal transduction histidine kinase